MRQMRPSRRARYSTLTVLAFALATPPAASAQRCDGCTADDSTQHMSLHPGVGLRFGEPQQASIAAGALIGSRWSSQGREHASDAAIFVEPGLSGGRASVAYLSYGRGNFGSGAALGISALRTWRNPWGVKPNVTYVGGELFVWPIVFVGPRIGVFHSVSAHAPNRWLISFDLGVGL